MSYLEIPITAVNGQTKYVIAKDKIMLVRQGDATLPNAGNAGTTVSLFLDSGLATQEVITFTHTVLSAAVIAAGYNVADIISEAIASNPSGGVSKVGGIPATFQAVVAGQNVAGQAATFVQFSAPVLA
tara:strand:+ start:508 stop:891 length:384 start_codon:yes stop_codon:yes gene_type:complete